MMKRDCKNLTKKNHFPTIKIFSARNLFSFFQNKIYSEKLCTGYANILYLIKLFSCKQNINRYMTYL